jgi:hypothetical protein
MVGACVVGAEVEGAVGAGVGVPPANEFEQVLDAAPQVPVDTKFLTFAASWPR